MTAVLIVCAGIVTTAALHAAPPSPVAALCPGARTATPTDAPAVVGDVPSGVLPAQLVAQPVRLDLVPVFDEWASICAVPAALVEATCWWESGWQADAVSVTGAVGVCQIEPDAAQTIRGLLGDPALDPRAPADNIEMSAAYLRWLLDETGGSRDLALAGYYQGLTSVEEHGILAVSRPDVAGITALLRDYTWD